MPGCRYPHHPHLPGHAAPASAGRRRWAYEETWRYSRRDLVSRSTDV